MKRICTSIVSGLFILSLILTFNINTVKAQTEVVVKDSVDMGVKYANDVYYSMINGTVKTVANKDWDISFFIYGPMLYGGAAGIYTNTANGVKLYTYPKGDITAWSTVDTTGVKSWKEMQNAYKTWNLGAFNANQGVFPDYGWGRYNSTTHLVVGDSLYIIKLANNQYKKIWIKENNAFTGVTSYYFKYANIDGTSEKDTSINYGPYVNRLMVYYSITSNVAFLDKQPVASSWDLVFTPFLQELYAGGFYRSIDIISNPFKVRTAKLFHCAPDTVNFKKASFTNNASEIGLSWKKIVQGQFLPADSAAFFVKDSVTHKVFRIVFLAAGSSAGDKVVFNKSQVVTSASEINGNTDLFGIYPNPVKEDLNILYDFKSKKSLNVSVYNLIGESIFETKIPASASGNQLSIYTIPLKHLDNGTYLLKLSSENNTVTRKFIVNK